MILKTIGLAGLFLQSFFAHSESRDAARLFWSDSDSFLNFDVYASHEGDEQEADDLFKQIVSGEELEKKNGFLSIFN